MRKRKSGFSSEEIAAMKDRVMELNAKEESGEKDVLAAIEKMEEPARSMAKEIHELIASVAPSLQPRTWYGMPAYANGKDVVCFFQNAGKFKVRYSTLGFSDKAHLDEDGMWPTSFALNKLTAKEKTRIAELVRKAVAVK
jgi:uncharacterized protein YdhG (YjbR/CyaY superfamily)